MIFFCFSSKDRHSIVEAILFHIMNYKLPVWYDRQEMLLGDDRNLMNFEEGVNKADYSIIILSQNAIASVCANEETELIYNRYKSGKITVFPLFYNLTANEIPEAFAWMKNLVYKELKDTIDVHSACNHIVCRVLLDELNKYKYRSFKIFYETYEHVPLHAFTIEILDKYNLIDRENYNARISLLYAIYLFIKSTYSLSGIPEYYYAGIDRLFNETKLNLKIDLREIIIFERLILLLLNAILLGYIS